MNGVNRKNSKSSSLDFRAGTYRVHKRGAFVGIWLALVGGLLFVITRSHDGGIPAAGSSGGAVRPLVPSPSVLAAHWAEIVSHATAPPRGAPRARYSLVEFGDFQCPRCAHAQPMIAGLLARYPRDVNLFFVQRPIPQVHCWALPTAQAAQIAAARGKFWPMYDAPYTHQDDFEPAAYLGYAEQAGLSRAALLGLSSGAKDGERSWQRYSFPRRCCINAGNGKDMIECLYGSI